jgi:hypothetical protein
VGLVKRSARSFSQRFLGRSFLPFPEQRTQVLGKNLVVLKSLPIARPGQRSGGEKLQAKHRPFLHGDSVPGEKRQIEFEAKNIHRTAFLDASKREAPSAVLLGKTFVSKMHRSPLVGAPAFEPTLKRK